MLTGIGAPTAWPFFKHGVAAAPASRTALGTAQGSSASTLTLAGINLALNDLLLVGTVNNNAFSASDLEVDINGNMLSQDSKESGASDLLVTINAWKATVAIVGGTITVTWTVDDPDKMALVACKVSGLLAAALQAEASVYFATTTNPDSGLTGPFALGFHWGVVGTAGRAADTLGTWQNGMTAGQRVSTVAVGVDLKEGWRFSAAAARSQILGQSNRKSIAAVVFYV